MKHFLKHLLLCTRGRLGCHFLDSTCFSFLWSRQHLTAYQKKQSHLKELLIVIRLWAMDHAVQVSHLYA